MTRPEAFLRTLKALAATLLLLGAACTDNVPGSTQNTQTAPTEAQLANALQVLNDPWGSFPTETGTRLSDYAQGVFENLLSVQGIDPERVDFRIVDAPFVYASFTPRPNGQSGTVTLSKQFLIILQDEAELAFIIGHELAHLELGHFVATGPTEAKADGGSGRFPFQPQEEYDADAWSVDALVAAGYDPGAAHRAMEQVRRTLTKLERLDGTEAPFLDLTGRLRALETTATGARFRDRYLDAIDGMPASFPNMIAIPLQNRAVVVPSIGLSFMAPEGFAIANLLNQVVIGNTDEGILISMSVGAAPDLSLSDQWRHFGFFSRDDLAASQSDPHPFKAMGGRDAVTGTARTTDAKGPVRWRYTIIDDGDRRIYVRTRVQDTSLDRADAILNALDASVRPMNAATQKTFNGLRLRVVRIKPGQTMATLQPLMGKDAPDALRVLNGMGAGDEPRPGDRIKLITPSG